MLENMQVLKVSDADTIVVTKKPRINFKYKKQKGDLIVRLQGIDAPETKQKWGTACAHMLRKKLLNKRVNILEEGRDKYGRVLGRVRFNGIDINRELVRQGCAWAYVGFDDSYIEDEKHARTFKLGLWRDKKQVPPWLWRQRNKGR